MSKLSQLKHEAYQAGKKRDWDRAVSIFEQILEIDKSNPMVINEMGDLCLKAGDTQRSLRHFLSAASRYRTTGLLNNAVAIYKKVLRYDPDNQSAHWYLAETRASQGLMVEGEDHAIRFLENSERVSGDIKEIFLKRCGQLFELYAGSKAILDKLLLIFRMWDMNLESARTNCLLACFSWEAGETDEAKAAMDKIAAKTPEVKNYPEFQRLSGLINPGSAAGEASSADVHSISFNEVEPTTVEAVSEPDAEPEVSDPDLDIPAVPEQETSFGGLAPETTDDREEQQAPESPETFDDGDLPEVSQVVDSSDLNIEQDDDGCFDLDADDDGDSFEDLMAQAASGLEDSRNRENGSFETESPAATEEADSDEPAPEAGQVDLLAQILAEDDGILTGTEESQREAITEDIGVQMGGGGDDQDPASLYEMGMVYLDMGMFDQAVDGFRKASEDPEFTARSYEMWGITLLKAQRPTEAINALKGGLEILEPGTKAALGLMYYLAQAYEVVKLEDEAVAQYEAIQRTDPDFLDVGHRLAALPSS